VRYALDCSSPFIVLTRAVFLFAKYFRRRIIEVYPFATREHCFGLRSSIWPQQCNQTRTAIGKFRTPSASI
jgi:hypothetical protein